MQNNIIQLSRQESHDIFPKNKKINMSKLLITTEGQFSVSKRKGAKKLVNIITNIMKTNDITITDGTANVGSDTLMLAKYFKYVNSIELDNTNFIVLKNNIDTYQYNNIKLINGDTTHELNYIKQDVIYIDAPWGGKNYKNLKQLKLFIGKMELSDVFNKFKNKTKLFIFKVQYNYDINNFLIKTKVKNLRIYSYQSSDRIKFLFLIIKIKQTNFLLK
jgi:hypothetical protein